MTLQGKGVGQGAVGCRVSLDPCYCLSGRIGEAYAGAPTPVASRHVHGHLPPACSLSTLTLFNPPPRARCPGPQEALSKAQAEAETLRKGSVEVAALQARLAATAQEADGYKSTAEEVEYLQEQLRRKTRLVVELQHKVGDWRRLCGVWGVWKAQEANHAAAAAGREGREDPGNGCCTEG